MSSYCSKVTRIPSITSGGPTDHPSPSIFCSLAHLSTAYTFTLPERRPRTILSLPSLSRCPKLLLRVNYLVFLWGKKSSLVFVLLCRVSSQAESRNSITLVKMVGCLGLPTSVPATCPAWKALLPHLCLANFYFLWAVLPKGPSIPDTSPSQPSYSTAFLIPNRLLLWWV